MLTFNTFKTALNAISLQFDALKKSFDAVSKKIPEPDWNENDPNSKNYVKNRTHYTKKDGTVVKLPKLYIPDEICMKVDDATKLFVVTETSDGVVDHTSDEIINAHEDGSMVIFKSNINYSNRVFLLTNYRSCDFTLCELGADLNIPYFVRANIVGNAVKYSTWEPMRFPTPSTSNNGNIIKVKNGYYALSEPYEKFVINLGKNSDRSWECNKTLSEIHEATLKYDCVIQVLGRTIKEDFSTSTVDIIEIPYVGYKTSGLDTPVEEKTFLFSCNYDQYTITVSIGPTDSNNISVNAEKTVLDDGTKLILRSATSGSTKQFEITVDDSGTISAKEITS